MTDKPITVDPATTDGWLNRFAAELRLRGADGAQTGEALAEVEAHVADSGQTPQEAFGDPRAYAESVLPRERALDRRPVIGAILVGVAGYLGAGGVLSAATSWGGEVPIRLGVPVAILVLAVTCWVIAQTFSTLVRSKNRAALPVALALALAVTVLAGVLLPQPVATLPAWVCAVAGLALLAGAASYLTMLVRKDPVEDPRTPLAPLSADEADLVAQRRVVEAMKRYRQRTGASLLQARRAVR